MQRKIKVRIKIRPYIKNVRTKHGKKQRVIHAHRKVITKNFIRARVRPVREIMKNIDQFPGGQAGRVARLNKNEDIPFYLEDPQSRVREQQGMKKHLDDFKDWAKHKGYKDNTEIIEFDGMNGAGIRGFTHITGPSVDWTTTVKDYIDDMQSQIKSRDNLIKEAESKQAEAAAIRLGRSKLF